MIPAAAEAQASASDTLAEIAVKLANDHKFEAALAASSAAIMLNPDEVTALTCRAQVLNALGRPAEAVPVLDHLFKVSRGHPSTSAGLGAALLAAGRPGDALQVVRAALLRRPTSDALLRLNADILWSLGLHEPAIDACRAALARCPDAPELQEGLGHFLYLARRPEEALPLCEAAFLKGRSIAATFSAVLLDVARHQDALAISEAGLGEWGSVFGRLRRELGELVLAQRE